MGRVAGKVALVTGAGSGLGRADAIRLAEEGARVVVTDVNEAAGRAVAAEVGGLFVRHDVRSEDEWRGAIAATMDRFGQLDVLVNNAGVVASSDIESTTLEQFRFINSVHVEGSFLGCKYGIEAMKGRGGSIINIASITALRGSPLVFAYVAAKGAIRSMTTTVAVHCKEKGYGIRCNAIFPGLIATPLSISVVGDIPMGKPEDVANLVLYLASDESRHMSGAELVIDDAACATLAG